MKFLKVFQLLWVIFATDLIESGFNTDLDPKYWLKNCKSLQGRIFIGMPTLLWCCEGTGARWHSPGQSRSAAASSGRGSSPSSSAWSTNTTDYGERYLYVEDDKCWIRGCGPTSLHVDRDPVPAFSNNYLWTGSGFRSSKWHLPKIVHKILLAFYITSKTVSLRVFCAGEKKINIKKSKRH